MEQPVYVHKAQAMCYAYIYAKQNRLERIGVQMTYCNLDTEEIRYFREIYTFETLTVWFTHLIEDYRKWADWQIAWKKQRQESIHTLEFPFSYRQGQKKLVADVYRTILRGKNLFIEAPTGVGKTISTIFPAVKAVGEKGWQTGSFISRQRPSQQLWQKKRSHCWKNRDTVPKSSRSQPKKNSACVKRWTVTR